MRNTIFKDKVVTFKWSYCYDDHNGSQTSVTPMAVICPTSELAETFKRMIESKHCRNISEPRIQSTVGGLVEYRDSGSMDKVRKVHRVVIDMDGIIDNPDNLDLNGAETLSVFLMMGRYFILWK